MVTAREVLGIIEQQGQGGPRLGAGGTDVCVCPECSYEEEHERGAPCNQKECPECGKPLTGKGAPGERKKSSGDNNNDDDKVEGPADRYDAYGHEEK